MSIKPIALVLTCEGVGGAEKRLAEIWLHLAPRLANLRMIVRRTTFEQLLLRPDLSGLHQFRDRVTLIDTRAVSYPATMAAFAPALWRLPRGSVVHHILQGPLLLHRLRGHRVIVSWVWTIYPNPLVSRSYFNHWLVSSLSLRSARLIDVLNPEISQELARRPSFRRKLRLTVGGTFVDGQHFRPGVKHDEVIFMGRIERYKNALAFAKAIPAIAERLAAAGRRAAFRLYGRTGDQGEKVRRLLASPEYQSLDVQWRETRDPADVLAPAKVFVSLQSPSNYPSKALAEAMACGCVPVISDSGQSRLMADPGAARFVPEHFTSEDLAKAVGEVLTLDDGAFAQLSAAVRVDALQRFRIEPQADYFETLYEELAGPSFGKTGSGSPA